MILKCLPHVVLATTVSMVVSCVKLDTKYTKLPAGSLEIAFSSVWSASSPIPRKTTTL